MSYLVRTPSTDRVWIRYDEHLPKVGKTVGVYDHFKNSCYLAVLRVDAIGNKYWQSLAPLNNEYYVSQGTIRAWMPKSLFKARLDKRFEYICLF